MIRLASIGLVAVGLLASGCQSTGSVEGPRGMVQELTVTRPITMALGGGGARFQYGDRTSALNPKDPYCVIRGGAHSLDPDTFIVTKVEHASTNNEEEDLPTNGDWYREVRLWLSSPVQPAIQQLICRRPTSLSGSEMSSADIQTILGRGFVLR